jgi:integrase/recombinase XerD
MLELFYSTGVRRSEMAEIRTVDCHITEKRLFIRKGKGGTQRWLPLGKKVSRILKQYLQTVRPTLVKKKTHEILLVGDFGGPLKGPRIYTLVSRYLKQLGVKSDCHGLRHTCATHLLKGKANIRVIQAMLGHESLSSTQIYTRVDISDMARAIEKFHPREKMQCDEP